MNYCTEAIEHILQDAKAIEKFSPSLSAALTQVAKDLQACHKFVVPSPNKFNIKATKTCLPFVRLPYPVCAFEYQMDVTSDQSAIDGLETHVSSKRIALAYDVQGDSEFVRKAKERGEILDHQTGIAVVSIAFVDSSGHWATSVGYGIFDTTLASPMADKWKTLDVEGQQRISEQTKNVLRKMQSNITKLSVLQDDLLIDNTTSNVFLEPIPFMQERAEDPEHQRASIVNDVASEIGTVVSMCMMLNAKNLNEVQIVTAPKFLNKKRLAKGKVPFFNYHTLDIFVSDGQKLSNRRAVSAKDVQQLFSKSSPGLHSVMGHMKVRKSGVYWWNSHMRGNADKGFVDKDYNVTEK